MTDKSISGDADAASRDHLRGHGGGRRRWYDINVAAFLGPAKQAVREAPSSVDVMVAELKPYPEYKDSGVEWLGNVPTHWDVRHLGRIGRFIQGWLGGTKEDAERPRRSMRSLRRPVHAPSVLHHGETGHASAQNLRPQVYTPIHYRDVLFAGSGETIDEIGKSAVNLDSRPGMLCRRRHHPPTHYRRRLARFLGYVGRLRQRRSIRRRVSVEASRSHTSTRASSST